MPKGVYACASAMLTESRALDVAAQNLANAQSSGYRKASPLRGTFAEYLAEREGRRGDLKGDGGAGVYQEGVYRSFTDGQRHETGGTFDLALRGDAFWQVRSPEGRLLLTRASSYTTDTANRLVDPNGCLLEGQGGPVTIPPDAERISVDQQGRIYAYIPGEGGARFSFIDQIRVGAVEAPGRLQAVNGQYFDPAGQEVRDAEGYEVRQGFVEESNVDPVGELVHLITIQRRYEAAQKAMRTQFETGGDYTQILAR